MDTEEGVEVVWNEVMISERKDFKPLQVSSASQNKTIKFCPELDDVLRVLNTLKTFTMTAYPGNSSCQNLPVMRLFS